MDGSRATSRADALVQILFRDEYVPTIPAREENTLDSSGENTVIQFHGISGAANNQGVRVESKQFIREPRDLYAPDNTGVPSPEDGTSDDDEIIQGNMNNQQLKEHST